MTSQNLDGTRTGTTCAPTTAVTRSLLGYGVLAGPTYVLVSLGQVLTRDGFDPTRHAWSLLANGPYGWIQVTNLVLSGLMVLAFAVGLGRALRPGPGATWGPRLVAGYGLGLVAAGAFRADPALGFPAGTPVADTPVTWHGTLHFVAGGIGFACLIAACLVLARRLRADGHRGLAGFTQVTGVLYLAAFVGIASGSGSVGLILAFTAAVILISGWMSVLAVHLYRRAGDAPADN